MTAWHLCSQIHCHKWILYIFKRKGVPKILLNLMLHARTRYQEKGGQNFVLTITNENSQQLPFTIITRLISSPNISFPHFRSFLILLTVLWIAPKRDSDGLDTPIICIETYSLKFNRVIHFFTQFCLGSVLFLDF